jgi:hypothetical protein
MRQMPIPENAISRLFFGKPAAGDVVCMGSNMPPELIYLWGEGY